MWQVSFLIVTVALDLEVAEAVARILQDGHALIGAIRHGGNQRAHVAVGHVEEFVDAGIDGRGAVLLQHGEKITLAHLAGADQGVEVTFLVTACTHVGEDHVDDVGARLAAVPDLHRGMRRHSA